MMPNAYDIAIQLTSNVLPIIDRSRLFNDFAYALGWHPSDKLDEPTLKDLTNGHLMVEHGLENSAVITFLKSPKTVHDLDADEQRRLLAISYNNLVDWHIYIGRDSGAYVFNRIDPPQPQPFYFSRADHTKLRSDIFEQISGKRQNPNLPSLDDALIDTISYWKRVLAAELGTFVSNDSLSALFNAIIFVRAVEDFRKLSYPSTDQVLVSEWRGLHGQDTKLSEIIKICLQKFLNGGKGTEIVNQKHLQVFDNLSAETVLTLLEDFYRIRRTPYQYNFALMSKHALSRIYEHYVSLLRIESSNQATLFPQIPEEERNKAFGSIYTPQYIARFFARYLREQYPPLAFRRILTTDPACGSGIFLRTILELQCDPTQENITTETIKNTFNNVCAIDIDPNAYHAINLSLSLLHLVLTGGDLPSKLNLINENALEYFDRHPELKESQDAVVANPPFISIGMQSQELKESIAVFMKELASGRRDIYLAFLRMSLEMVKPGGYVLFVLPHSFLINQSGKKMRRYIAEVCWVRCIADLSAIRVFGETGSYIILLILQKKLPETTTAPPATIIKCQEFVGRALQEALEGKRVQTDFYSVHDVSQEPFQENEWILLSSAETKIKQRLNSLKRLGDFLEIGQGMVIGKDEIFIINRSQVPKGEEDIFVPFLPDRLMERYTIPKSTDKRVFYPFRDGQKLSESEIKKHFPKTWAYLNHGKNRSELQKRYAVRERKLPWWMPENPRASYLLFPKIVSPYLVLIPRFSLDHEGKFAISHSPLLYPKENVASFETLRFFLAILNSTAVHWYLSTHSYRYSKGYIKLDPMYLRGIPIPDLGKVPAAIMKRLLRLVSKRLAMEDDPKVEAEIDEIIADLYGFPKEERRIIGME